MMIDLILITLAVLTNVIGFVAMNTRISSLYSYVLNLQEEIRRVERENCRANEKAGRIYLSENSKK